jgi:hypothetical protein
LARSAHTEFTGPAAESPDQPSFTEQSSSANGEFSDSLTSGICFALDVNDSLNENQYVLGNNIVSSVVAAELFMEYVSFIHPD